MAVQTTLLSTAPALIPVAAQAASAAPLPGTGAYVFQVLLGLAFVLLLVFASAWLMKRVGRGGMGGDQMRVLSAMPMGNREKLVIVDVCGQQLLLGVTAHSINTLHTFEHPVITPKPNAGESDFAERLKEILAKGVTKS